jgi:hypothetical protein
VSPNFPHLIALVLWVIEACEDSVDIVCIFLHHIDIILLCLDESLTGAGRPEEVRPNMGQIMAFVCIPCAAGTSYDKVGVTCLKRTSG